MDGAAWSVVEIEGQPVLRQAGRNQFIRDHDILEAIPLGEPLEQTLGRVIKRIGLTALVGFVVGTGTDIALRVTTGEKLDMLHLSSVATDCRIYHSQ